MNYPKQSALERELVSSLRESAAGSPRAMAATVVSVSPVATAEQSDAFVDALMGRRPVRILHLRIGTGAAEPFHSWASARCSLDRQNRGVCFEDIYIESADDAAADPRSWGAFVLRELPALLLWNIPLFSCPSCMGDWADTIDLVAFDGGVDPASRSGEAKDYAQAVLSSFSAAPALADFSWERLERVRIAVARLFDSPGSPKSLGSVSSVEVRAEDPWGRSLLAGWIASRPGLGGVEVRAVDLGLPSVRFLFKDGSRGTVEFPDGRNALLSFPTGETLEVPFSRGQDGDILARLIDVPLADPLYAAALRFIAGA